LLIAETARVYLAIAANEARLNLARSTLTTQQDFYNLIQRQHELKLRNEIDLFRAQAQLDAARSEVAFYTQQIAQYKNALTLLCGCDVNDELLARDLSGINFRAIYPLLPSDVLLKRPDVMEAEHQLKAAYANIGAARATFFPSISLTSAIGSASSSLNNLFSAGRGTWAYSPQVVLPIFDMRTWAAYRVSDANRRIALTMYEKAIQTAFSEVADVLAVRGTIDEQMAAQQSAVEADQKIYELSSKRYNIGIDSYLSVLDAQRSLYGAQQELIGLQVSKLANEVKAYAVLGGGANENTEINALSRDLIQEKELLSLTQ